MPKKMIAKIVKLPPAKLRRPDWIQLWAGSWSILPDSHFARQYTRLIYFFGQPYISEQIIFIKKGKTQCWAKASDRVVIANKFAAEVLHDTARAKAICQDLKKQTDVMLKFIASRIDKPITLKIYQEFWQKCIRYYKPHIRVKYVVDALPPARLKQLLPYYEEARVYCEPVFHEVENFMVALAKQIGADKKLPPNLVLSCLNEEIEKYFLTGRLPARTVLAKRFDFFAIYANKTTDAFFVGATAKQAEKVVTEVIKVSELKGQTAYPGQVVGVVRVVPDPKKVKNFKTGDILVTGMTRPEFLPLMKKAGGFVTDSGGILSHAAIVARELKKPCVIGTKNATKIFKDGDKVEVDATRGIVKKI